MTQTRHKFRVGDFIQFHECPDNWGRIDFIAEENFGHHIGGGYLLEDSTFIHFSNEHLWDLRHMQRQELRLPLKRLWYDMIRSGEKPEEYREITPYWMRRLCWDLDTDQPADRESCDYLCTHPESATNMFFGGWRPRHFTHAHFTLGYPTSLQTDRHMVIPIERILIGTGRKEWGADEDKEYFVIRLRKE